MIVNHQVPIEQLNLIKKRLTDIIDWNNPLQTTTNFSHPLLTRQFLECYHSRLNNLIVMWASFLRIFPKSPSYQVPIEHLNLIKKSLTSLNETTESKHPRMSSFHYGPESELSLQGCCNCEHPSLDFAIVNRTFSFNKTTQDIPPH